MTTASVSAVPRQRAVVRQKIAKTARWLHIYLSMVSFAIVLFFAVTGLTLNHPDWFASAIKTSQRKGSIDRALLAQPDNAPGREASQRRLTDALRTREHLHGTVDEVRVGDTDISFSFRAPGYSADVAIDRDHSTYSVTEVRNGFVAVLNDLHKGRDSGKAWAWVIDLSAVLLTLVSFTGLVILWFIYKRRVSGFVMVGVGLALSLIAYKIFVP